MEENKETPNSPTEVNKSDESYSQCMSPTPDTKKNDSIAAESQSTIVNQSSIPAAATDE